MDVDHQELEPSSVISGKIVYIILQCSPNRVNIESANLI
jgi:hypothetical protein